MSFHIAEQLDRLVVMESDQFTADFLFSLSCLTSAVVLSVNFLSQFLFASLQKCFLLSSSLSASEKSTFCREAFH
jgi:hypothetical protein